MDGLILLFLVVVATVFVVPAVALAKASRALRAIEELKQRLLMLEERLHRSPEDEPALAPEIVTQPKSAAPIIPPELRVAIGFLAGIALVIGGVALKRKENVVTAQTLCATGILILYAVTFACRSFYHFPFFGLIPTFALMSLITAAAFLLAVR